jgi:hypothetical protein
MQFPRAATLCVLASAVATFTGCALGERFAQRAGGAADAQRYGGEDDVLATIAAVKKTGRAQSISNRAVRLPVQEFYPMTQIDYELPAACGSLAFRVYEAGNTQILEYTLLEADGTLLSIRDYVTGTNPFIRPGLWTALDHTADSVSFMMTDFAETKSQIIPEVYSKGLVTGLPEMLQRTLGAEYRRAVHAAAMCDEPAASLVAARK